MPIFGLNWELFTDIVAPGDFEGDGKADPAVFRPSTGQWWVRLSTGPLMLVNWGTAGDYPVQNFDIR